MPIACKWQRIALWTSTRKGIPFVTSKKRWQTCPEEEEGREERAGEGGLVGWAHWGLTAECPDLGLYRCLLICVQSALFLDYLVQHCTPDFQSSAWCVVSAQQTLVGCKEWTNGWLSVWGGEEQLIRPGRHAHAREERGIPRNGYPCGQDRLSTHCFTEQRQSKGGRNDFLKSRGLSKLEFREDGRGLGGLRRVTQPLTKGVIFLESDCRSQFRWSSRAKVNRLSSDGGPWYLPHPPQTPLKTEQGFESSFVTPKDVVHPQEQDICLNLL